MKVACFTVACMDFFPQVKKCYAGGNSLNQAMHFCHMGHPTSFIGALGMDDAGNQIEKLLKSRNIDISHLYRVEGKTASNQIVNDNQGERFGIEGAWDGGVYEKFRMKDSDWNYLDAFDIWIINQTSPDFFQTLHRKKKHHFLSVDFLDLENREVLRESVHHIDISFIGGTVDMIDELANITSNGCKNLIVLTLGSKGSIAFQGKNIFRQKALPLDKVVDTTGCGDAFQAGFTASYFQNRDIQKALQAGAELGKKTACHYGGIDSNIFPE